MDSFYVSKIRSFLRSIKKAVRLLGMEVTKSYLRGPFPCDKMVYRLAPDQQMCEAENQKEKKERKAALPEKLYLLVLQS